MEDDLIASGRFVRVTTVGGRTGLERSVTIGFVEDDEVPGSILVSAGGAETAWARNLRADPACRVEMAERSWDAVAEPLTPAEHALAIRGLILRYGTPAEGLGRGDSFRLRPVDDAPDVGSSGSAGPRAVPGSPR
jgi:deazaflavin-dependent oxidoreductase (nitroreductase family)